MEARKGAYILRIRLHKSARIQVGRLGYVTFSPGDYLYVGNAIRNLDARVSRHLRLSENKTGGGKWHVDALLRHRAAGIISVAKFPDMNECDLSHHIAHVKGIEVPVPGFGATDCRNNCAAHLYDATNASPNVLRPLFLKTS